MVYFSSSRTGGMWEVQMAEKVFQKVRLVGCSGESVEKAVEAVVKQAGEQGTAYWFELVELRGAIAKGKVSEWQAVVDVAVKP
jgi:flavin-binding protein dodecin